MSQSSLPAVERLESILVQFINFYELWAEDQKLAVQHGADIKKLIKEFSGHVADFKLLEEKVRKDIHESIHTQAKNMATYVGRSLGDAAIKEVEPTVKKLREVAYDASDRLSHYQADHKLSSWKTIGMTAFSSIVVSLLIVWGLMPKPTLPLTGEQIKLLQSGQLMARVWPKLSKKEQQHWQALADHAGQP
jgi:hypothetical protein